MTELRDVLLTLADPPLLPPEPLEDLQNRTLRRHRRRTHIRLAATGLTVAVMAVPVLIFLREEDASTRLSAISEATSSVPANAGAPTPTGIPATAETSLPAPTTTQLQCRNSHDPACGPFRWDPEPAPLPPRVTVNVEPATPVAGEEVVFVVEIESPTPDVGPSFLEPGDGGSFREIGGVERGCTLEGHSPLHGPWDPLDAADLDWSTRTVRLAHTYDAPGTYVARFGFDAARCFVQRGYPSPFPGTGAITVTVTVVAAG